MKQCLWHCGRETTNISRICDQCWADRDTRASAKSTDCVDLRPWAKTNRYRWRFEESYGAERPENRGDGRWYVEILCKHGLIYPKGGDALLAVAKAGVCQAMEAIPGVTKRRTDDKGREFMFPLACLDDVAAALKPKRLPGRAELTPEHRETLKRYAFQGGQKP